MSARSTAIARLMATRTGGWCDDERAALERIIADLRPSARHLSDVLDWLDDIGARDGRSPGDVLADPALERACTAGGSAPDRLKRWKEALRRLRYPRLTAREAEAAALVRSLALGPAVRVQLPPALEGGALTVTVTAASADELAGALARLEDALASGGIAELFRLLDEV